MIWLTKKKTKKPACSSYLLKKRQNKKKLNEFFTTLKKCFEFLYVVWKRLKFFLMRYFRRYEIRWLFKVLDFVMWWKTKKNENFSPNFQWYEKKVFDLETKHLFSYYNICMCDSIKIAYINSIANMQLFEHVLH